MIPFRKFGLLKYRLRNIRMHINKYGVSPLSHQTALLKLFLVVMVL